MTRIAVTGSSGYIGSALINFLQSKGYEPIPLSRNSNPSFSLDQLCDYSFVSQIDVLIHCAHDFKKNSETTNISGSKLLFEACSAVNVKIIFISSISAFSNAVSKYGRTKFQIEQLAIRSGAIIIRPGLVYDLSKPGSMFLSLVKIIKTFPLVPIIDGGTQIQFMCNLDSLCVLLHQLSFQHSKYKGKIVTAACREPEKLHDILILIAHHFHKRRWFFSISSSTILAILTFIELFKIPIRTNKDSLISLLNQNQNPDFSFLDNFKVNFPPLRSMC